MSTLSLKFVIVTIFACILLANGNPIDSQEENEILLCPDGGAASSGRKKFRDNFFEL